MIDDKILCPVDAVAFNGKTVIYRRVDEWIPVTQPYMAGGTITQYTRSGRKILEAHEFGRSVLLELTPELVAAIEADEQRQARKRSHHSAGETP